MAGKKVSNVLLGFQDEYINEKHKPLIDYSTNKIGGKPDWCQRTHIPNTQCRLCGSNLPLVMQVYAPLEGSKYHRTLYIFACIQPMCWNRAESWLCVRQQCICGEDQSMSLTEASSSVCYWNAEADNWDSEDDLIPSVDQENGNIVVHRPLAIKNQRAHEDTDTDDSSISLEDVNDPNANSAGAEGAFAVEFSNKVHIASAEIEIGDESDIVSIDTPTRAQPVAELFVQANCKSRKIPILHPEFIASFISVSEDTTGNGSLFKLNDHEMSLLHQYQQSELGGGDLSLDGRGVDAGGGGDLTAEQYEKDVPIHGDVLAHRFISRLQQYPGQILRYGRGCDPLLLQPLSKGTHKQKCQHCGGEMVFEMQLLPALLSCLSLTERVADASGMLEFGTVLIYTCKDSCWNSEETGYKLEHLIVQAESI